ncbi:MAG: ABC transporter ATP-binding protein [Geminicoccaceae bacterium]
MQAPPLVRVDDLTRWFDVSKPLAQRLVERAPRRIVKAVEGVDFAIPPGDTLSLVGESGCGKSTVARLVAGLDRPTRGSIEFKGGRGAAVRLQMVFQDPMGSLNPRWRIGRSVAEPLPGTMSAGQRRDRVAELLATVGLTAGDAQRYPHEFSGGQRQRISIARALAADAEFLVLDEPTSALDVSVQAQVLNLLEDLRRRLGLTFLFISHNLAVVRHVSDRIAVMYLGRMVEEGPAAEILAEPAHPYTRLLLETVPDPFRPRRDRTPLSGEVPNPIDPPAGCSFHPRCPLVMPLCRSERPVLKSVGAAHKVACHAVG